MSWVRKPKLTDVSVASGLSILAYAEYLFGTKVLDLPYLIKTEGFPPISLALAVPLFFDSYALTAFAKGKDEKWAMGLIVTSATLGLTAHIFDINDKLRLVTTVVFSALVAVVMWRVKHLSNELDAEDRARIAEEVRLRTEAEDRRQAALTRSSTPVLETEDLDEEDRSSVPKLEVVKTVGDEDRRTAVARTYCQIEVETTGKWPGADRLRSYLKEKNLGIAKDGALELLREFKAEHSATQKEAAHG